MGNAGDRGGSQCRFDQRPTQLQRPVSMLRTVELLLGLRHDAARCRRTSHGESFMAKADLRLYGVAGQNHRDEEPAGGYGAVASARMDFRGYDRIDEDALNRILWHSIKGVDVPYPAPVRRALPTPLGLFRFPKDAD